MITQREFIALADATKAAATASLVHDTYDADPTTILDPHTVAESYSAAITSIDFLLDQLRNERIVLNAFRDQIKPAPGSKFEPKP